MDRLVPLTIINRRIRSCVPSVILFHNIFASFLAHHKRQSDVLLRSDFFLAHLIEISDVFLWARNYYITQRPTSYYLKLVVEDFT